MQQIAAMTQNNANLTIKIVIYLLFNLIVQMLVT